MNALSNSNNVNPIRKSIIQAQLYGKRLISVVLTVAICLSILDILDYIYVNDCVSWERTIMNELSEQEDNIDLLYLGSSHVFTSVIPEKMDSINGRNNFNLATPAQSYMTSYYLLKEALRHNDLEHVYLEMYYMIPYVRGDLNNIEVMSTHWDILYQMPLSLNKLDYGYHLLNKQYGLMTLFPIRRFANHVFDTQYIKTNLEQKKSENYKNAVYTLDPQAPTFKKGFCTISGHIEPGTFEGNTGAIPGDWEDENAKTYLNKIIDLCQRKNIDLTFFTAPMPDFRLCCMGNYDQYIAQVNDIANKYGLRYYDFNLCNTKYLNLQNDKYIMDYDHLGYEGAQLFTDILAEVLLDELECNPIPEDMFYASYNEKLRQIDQRIFGLDIQENSSGKQKIYTIYSIDNLVETEAEFRITKQCEGDTQPITVQEWSTQNCVTFPEIETGVFIVEARPVQSKEVTNRVEINY